ncbi:MAG: hypothetical protein V4671_28190 [Armatimonadota bacterium]
MNRDAQVLFAVLPLICGLIHFLAIDSSKYRHQLQVNQQADQNTRRLWIQLGIERGIQQYASARKGNPNHVSDGDGFSRLSQVAAYKHILEQCDMGNLGYTVPAKWGKIEISPAPEEDSQTVSPNESPVWQIKGTVTYRTSYYGYPSYTMDWKTTQSWDASRQEWIVTRSTIDHSGPTGRG